MRDAVPPVSGCILAGGQGLRLGGADKGLLSLGSCTLVERCIASLEPQVQEIMISANRNQAQYRVFADKVFADAFGEFAGPLAGFLAAMENADSPYVVTVPCDSPFIPADLVARLWRPVADGEGEISVVRSNQRLQPVFSLFPVSLVDSLTAFLARGERRINGWFQQHALAVVDFGDTNAFMNINSAEDYARANALAAP